MISTAYPVHVGDYVRIVLWTNQSKRSEGTVDRIVKDSNPPTVILRNGDKGQVLQVLHSEDIVKKRIMAENQYVENKETFSEDVMRTEVIPRTVQSFLNSEGGFLYIGIRDTGDLDERLVGLDYDFRLIKDGTDIPNDKIRDKFERQIMGSLEKYLESEASLGPLVEIRFVRVCDVQVVEISIGKSPKPWFYKNISKSNKPKKFDLHWNGKVMRQQFMDDFYIRDGGGKKLLQTHKDFYTYAKNRFTNSRSEMVEIWQ